MRKIKRELREKAGLPVGIQVLPKPIRAPEEIKQIKTEQFAKIGSNKRQKFDENDYQTSVNQQNPDSIIDFVNNNIKKHIQSKKPTENENFEQLTDLTKNISKSDFKLIS